MSVDRLDIDWAAPIDWNNNLCSGMVFCTAPMLGSFSDLVNQSKGTPLALPALSGQSRFGQALQSSDTTNGGMYWPWNSRFASMTRSCTVAIWANITSWASWSALMSIPYASGSWVGPYASIIFQRNSVGSAAKFTFSVSGAANDRLSSSGYLATTNGMTLYVVTNTASSTVFYKNGSQFSTGSGNAGAYDFTNKQPICVFNHSNSSKGEAIGGTCPFAAVWNRALSASEVLSLYRDTFQLFRRMPWGIYAPAGGGFPFNPSLLRKRKSQNILLRM